MLRPAAAVCWAAYGRAGRLVVQVFHKATLLDYHNEARCAKGVALLSWDEADALSAELHGGPWGVPLTLARMPEDTARAVFEIGMSTPGEIAPRSQMVRPHTGIVTCIAGAHLEGLGSLSAVAHEKADIFSGMEAGGTFILPADDEFFDYLAGRARRFCPTGKETSQLKQRTS